MDDLKHHFEMGYAPNNATMVVVGDATPDEIFQLCEKYIEPIPQHAPPPPVDYRGTGADGRTPAGGAQASGTAAADDRLSRSANQQSGFLCAEYFADGAGAG